MEERETIEDERWEKKDRQRREKRGSRMENRHIEEGDTKKKRARKL